MTPTPTCSDAYCRRSGIPLGARMVLRLPHPALKQIAHPVGEVGETEQQLGFDLLATMRASPACVGIAATQIGVGIRAFCIDVSNHPKADSCHGELVLFNPTLVEATAFETSREGCMSVPDLTGNVRRPSEIVVHGLDLDGRMQVIEANAFEARALLHELDHLDGLLFLDRVGSATSDLFRRKRYR